jgi:hypothetical protein
MITAQEARERSQLSIVNLETFIERLGVKIQEQADLGKYEYHYRGDLPGDPTKSNDLLKKTYERFETPKFWQLVIDKLKVYPLNFNVTVHKAQANMRASLGSLGDQEPEPHYTYSLLIKW